MATLPILPRSSTLPPISGAAGVGLNPLHALFDDRASDASPYAPNSRLFLNPLYIDVGAMPEFPGLEAAGLEEEVERLRKQDIVDYDGVANAKMRALELAYEVFREEGSMKRRRALRSISDEREAPRWFALRASSGCAGNSAIPGGNGRTSGEGWRQQTLDTLRRTEAVSIGFFEFVQWVAHEQLDRCRAKARARGLPLGLYLDIAVGVCSDGFDAWCDQDAVLSGIAVGAPPDILNTAGQNWGLAGFNPAGLEDQRFEPFRHMLQASMRYAGAIRLDHVLGLKRLYLIPHGVSPSQGAYIRFPFEAMLAVTALCQHGTRVHRCGGRPWDHSRKFSRDARGLGHLDLSSHVVRALGERRFFPARKLPAERTGFVRNARSCNLRRMEGST